VLVEGQFEPVVQLLSCPLRGEGTTSQDRAIAVESGSFWNFFVAANASLFFCEAVRIVVVIGGSSGRVPVVSKASRKIRSS
jgi:hypothetical protein